MPKQNWKKKQVMGPTCSTVFKTHTLEQERSCVLSRLFMHLILNMYKNKLGSGDQKSILKAFYILLIVFAAAFCCGPVFVWWGSVNPCSLTIRITQFLDVFSSSWSSRSWNILLYVTLCCPQVAILPVGLKHPKAVEQKNVLIFLMVPYRNLPLLSSVSCDWWQFLLTSDDF